LRQKEAIMAGSSDRPLTTIELADYLQVPVATVYQWSSRGIGPRQIRVGRHLRFRMADVQAWLDARASGADDLDVAI
jgi:excisionase family DNA binding protein